jgi:hypothetical protein
MSKTGAVHFGLSARTEHGLPPLEPVEVYDEYEAGEIEALRDHGMVKAGMSAEVVWWLWLSGGVLMLLPMCRLMLMLNADA